MSCSLVRRRYLRRKERSCPLIPAVLNPQTLSLRRQSSPLSVDRINASSLESVGVSRDSVQRILDVISQLGIPGPASVTTRETNSATAYGRLDYRPHQSPTALARPDLGPSPLDDQLTLLLGLNAANGAAGPGGLSLAAPRNTTSSYGGLATATLSRYMFGWLLNETNLSFQFSNNSAGPDILLPGASVRIGATPGGGANLSSLSFGGSGSGRGDTRSSMIQLRNETAWYTRDSKHQFKVAAIATLDNYQTAPPPSFGVFTYYSIDGLATGQPAAFVRTTVTGQSDSHAFNAAFSLGESQV